jgi:hypothetical protein
MATVRNHCKLKNKKLPVVRADDTGKTLVAAGGDPAGTPHQYSLGSRIVVALRSASVITQTFTSGAIS